MKLGAKVDIISNHGNTPLHLSPTSIIINTLISAPEININVQDSNGNTILHEILDGDRDPYFKNTVSLLDKLLKRGADCNIINNAGW